MSATYQITSTQITGFIASNLSQLEEFLAADLVKRREIFSCDLVRYLHQLTFAQL